MSATTYITTEELGNRIHYNQRYINGFLKDKIFLEGVHYIRPFGGRKILYIWEAIERDMHKKADDILPVIPMASGGYCHG